MHADHVASNVRRLRIARGMTQANVAERAGLSRVAYRNIESGSSTPRIDSLMAIAAALETPLGVLVEPTRSIRAVRFRADKRMNRRDQVLADVTRWLDDYRQLEDLVGEHVRFDPDAIRNELDPHARGSRRARFAAVVARQRLGFTPDEIVVDLVGRLEEHGLKIGAVDVASDAFFGLCIAGADGGPAVVVNTWERISVERWIFTAAHELAHLLLHTTAFDAAERDEEPKQEEQANEFASYFLMPEQAFDDHWQRACGLRIADRVLVVKSMFRVSARAVLIRAFPDDFERGWALFREDFAAVHGRALGERDEPDRLPPSVFRLTRRDRLVRRAIENGLLSVERAGEIMAISTDDMEQRIATWGREAFRR